MNARSDLQIVPLTPALGAEIYGVDLAEPIAEDVFERLRQAFLKHLVIFFRDQSLNRDQHIAFARRFGELDIHPFVKPVDPKHPEIIPVIKEANDTGDNFGGVWHSDVSFMQQPSLGSILYAKDIPACGGDTMWANMYLAYETLSPGLQEMLHGLRAVHSASRAYGTDARYLGKSMDIDTGTEQSKEQVLHPVVRTHPETGKKLLYVNPGFTVRFEKMKVAESEALLDFIFEHSIQPETTCRFRWQKGSVAFWDNRCTWHFPLNDYHGHRRELERVTIRGTVPQ